jgi:GT2 family glycosyltransferase
MYEKHVSIVIPTYNHLDLLKECLESVIKFTFLEDKEILVVSNGSTDDTREYVTNLSRQYPQIKLLWFTEALGYTRAANRGIEIAVGEYIILLNNDCVILNDQWVAMLLEPMSDPEVGLTGPSKQWCSFAETDFLVFFCVCIRSSLFKELGLLREIWNLGAGEDTAFCLEAKKLGYKLVQVPSQDPLQISDGICVGPFSIFHKGEGTVHAEPFASLWKENCEKNQKKLRDLYAPRIKNP